jgi:3-dehydroquinate dehydratase-2
MRVLLLHGPNLNLLGTRQPEIYGHTTLGELEEMCREWAAALGCELDVFQSNHEGALIDRLHDAIAVYDGVVLNAGALTHYSYALADAIRSVPIPTVEVHLSDIGAREEWRARSVLSDACIGTIAGHGPDGYREALELLTRN